MTPKSMCMCWSLLELSFGLGLKWASTPLGPLRVLFKGARTPPKPREVCNRRFENSSKNRSFLASLLEERRGGKRERGDYRPRRGNCLRRVSPAASERLPSSGRLPRRPACERSETKHAPGRFNIYTVSLSLLISPPPSKIQVRRFVDLVLDRTLPSPKTSPYRIESGTKRERERGISTYLTSLSLPTRLVKKGLDDRYQLAPGESTPAYRRVLACDFRSYPR